MPRKIITQDVNGATETGPGNAAILQLELIIAQVFNVFVRGLMVGIGLFQKLVPRIDVDLQVSSMDGVVGFDRASSIFLFPSGRDALVDTETQVFGRSQDNALPQRNAVRYDI